MKIKILFIALLSSVLSWAQLTEGFESGLPAGYSATTNYTLVSGAWSGTANQVLAGTPTGVKTGTYCCQLRSQVGASVITPNITVGVGTVTFWGSSSIAALSMVVLIGSPQQVLLFL
jgi:hypothetical protein